jgi:hypothetical protein
MISNVTEPVGADDVERNSATEGRYFFFACNLPNRSFNRPTMSVT